MVTAILVLDHYVARRGSLISQSRSTWERIHFKATACTMTGQGKLYIKLVSLPNRIEIVSLHTWQSLHLPQANRRS